MSKTTMSKNEIEQKIRDLKTKLSCQESDIGDWKIAKCIEYSTLGMESPYDLQELHKQRQVIRDEIGALEEELAKCEDEDEAASEKQALFTKLLSKKAEGFSLRFVLINTGNISRKVLSKVLRSFDKNFERLQLAAIIQCEAWGESYDGKLAVGSVIMNRVRSSYFPNTVSGVIYQGGQFSPVASGRLAYRLEQGVASDCMSAAQAVLGGTSTTNCLYFRVNNGIIEGTVIGNHVFY